MLIDKLHHLIIAIWIIVREQEHTSNRQGFVESVGERESEKWTETYRGNKDGVKQTPTPNGKMYNILSQRTKCYETNENYLTTNRPKNVRNSMREVADDGGKQQFEFVITLEYFDKKVPC